MISSTMLGSNVVFMGQNIILPKITVGNFVVNWQIKWELVLAIVKHLRVIGLQQREFLIIQENL